MSMTFEEFSKRFRCSITSKMQSVGHRQTRSIESKTYIIYIDIRTMLPFNPKTYADCLNCISFSSESGENAKRKAFDFIKESGSLDDLNLK